MDHYPYGNFRDNPPLPLHMWYQHSFFNPEAHSHTIPHVVPSDFHHNQVDNPYLPYTPIPVLFPPDPFTSNFSFPPPLPRIQIPAHIELHGRTFHPPLAPSTNAYFLLQTPSYHSDISSRHPLTGPDVLDRQSVRNEFKKQYAVQEERPIFMQDQFISEFKNTECANPTVTISEDHDNVYTFEQQYQEQEQPTPQTIQDLSEQLQKQLEISGEHSTVKYGNSLTLKMNIANAEISVNEGYQTVKQDKNHVIQEEQIGFLPNQIVKTEGKAIKPHLGAPHMTEPIPLCKQNETYNQPGVIFTQTISEEQEKCTAQQQPSVIQEELIINKDQDKHHGQSHQDTINSEQNQQTLDQFQDKHEDKQRLQKSIKKNKPERRNWDYHRRQPSPQHAETPYWQHSNHLSRQHQYPKTHYPDWQTGMQHIQQSYPNAIFKGRFSQDTYQHVGSHRMATDVRFNRDDNRHNKGSVTPSSKGGKNKKLQEGSSCDDQKAASTKSEGSRYYINRHYKSTS